MTFVVENGEVYAPTKMPEGTVVIVEGTKVTFVGLRRTRYPEGTEFIDASDKIVAPGFIDMHIHGCAGFDVSEGRRGFLEEMSGFLAKHGVTSFLPTTVSTSKRKIIEAIENVRRARKGKVVNVLGLYLEGPYINVEKAGAQNPRYIKDPNLGEVEEILGAANKIVKVVALAPKRRTRSMS